MARLVAVAFVFAGLTGSGTPTALHGYGMSITIPPGWHGRITHGLVRVRGEGLFFEIRESTPEARPDPFFRRRTVPTLHATDFRSAEHHLGFTLSGRQFALLPFPAQRVTPSAIRTANDVLRSFTAKPGRFYGQALPPARFPMEPGWFVGARGGKLLAEGGQTETWAATVPYRDPPLQIPPHRTLRRLAPDSPEVPARMSPSVRHHHPHRPPKATGLAFGSGLWSDRRRIRRGVRPVTTMGFHQRTQADGCPRSRRRLPHTARQPDRTGTRSACRSATTQE